MNMWKSCLLIDVGSNPDRPRPGRLWLRNLYHVHQRFCMAFPSKEKDDAGKTKQERDTGFLSPYDPEDFPEHRHLADRSKAEVGPDVLKQVHRPRGTDVGFLFRIDPEESCCGKEKQAHSGRVVILVQSAAEPNWEYAFKNAGYLLAAPPQVKTYDTSFNAGQRLRFRLIANPTRRLSKGSLGSDGRPVEKGIGKRVPVPADRLLEWLSCRAEKAGFSLESDSVSLSPGYAYLNKSRNGDGVRLRSVRYDGLLSVADPARFREALAQGVGPGKAFGFGLLSVAPCRTSPPAEAA